MKTILLRIIPILALLIAFDLGAQSFVVKKNLKDEWLAFDGDKFVPFAQDETGSKVFYLKIKNPEPLGEFIRINSKEPVFLFINNKLFGKIHNRTLNIDSLANDMAGDLLIAVHFDSQSVREISSELLSKKNVQAVSELSDKRRPYFFHDFVIMGTLLLFILVTTMVRMNPKLASDYFSIPRIFSFRETEDAQVYARIGSSANVLFYAYCSMLLGFYLIVIFHFVPSVYPVSYSFEAESFGGAFLQWIKLSAILLGLLLLKIILITTFSTLFGIREVAGIHFFNWVRVVVVFLGLLTLSLVIYFIWYGQDISILALMLRLLAWIMAGWIVLIFLKLAGKSGASMFHLFSYICATELIPFLFIIKVLYN